MAQKVTAPQRQPRVGGIKSVASTFIDEPRLLVEDNLVWEDSGCGFPAGTRAGCYDTVVASAPKEFEAPDNLGTIGPAFAQVAGISCWIGGDNDEAGTYQAQAQRKLEATEDRAIEAKLWAWADAATGTVASPDLVAALAAAEEHADAEYVGAPLILLSRQNVTLLKAEGALEIRENGAIHTANGNRVVASSSFGSDAVAAIGWPAVYASAVVTAMAHDHTKNVDVALAERAYSVGVDCEYRFTATV